MSYLIKTTDIVIAVPIEHLVDALTGKKFYTDDGGLIEYLEKHKKIINNYGNYQIKDDDDNKFYPVNTIMDKILIIKHRNVFIKSREWISEKYINVTKAISDKEIADKHKAEKAREVMKEINKKIMK